MTKSFLDGASLCLRAIVAAGLLAASGCASMKAPTAQSIAGLTPSGDVTITEDFVTGLGGGSGTLNYQGQAYPFRVSALSSAPAAVFRRSLLPVRSITSTALPTFPAGTRKAPVPPV